jgi:hypothetical protein
MTSQSSPEGGHGMKHTITILAHLNNGDMIVRTTAHGARRMTRTELVAHRAAGATVIDQRRRAA